MRPEPTYYTIDDDTAREAHYANSFSEFRSDVDDYRKAVDAAYDLAEKAAERDPDSEEYAYSLADRYARDYAAWLNHGYHIDAMCPSVMIAGPANFPTRKKERQNERRDKHMRELEKIDAILEKINRIGDPDAPIKANDPKAVEKLTAKLEALEVRHQAMKDANAEARKEGRPAPFMSSSLANNRRAIKATRERIESIKAAKAEDVPCRRELRHHAPTAHLRRQARRRRPRVARAA